MQVKKKCEDQNLMVNNKYLNEFVFKQPTTLKSIHYGILNYNDYPNLISFNGIDLKIKEVYSDALIMYDIKNENVKYCYVISDDKLYKI